MKFYVVNLNTFIDCFRWIGSWSSHEKLVINTEFTFRHASQLSFHHNLSNNIWSEQSPFVWNEYIDIFNNVNEKLVFPVFDSFSSPRNCTSSLNCNLLHLFNAWWLFHFSLGNVKLEEIWVANLRQTKIHNLI